MQVEMVCWFTFLERHAEFESYKISYSSSSHFNYDIVHASGFPVTVAIMSCTVNDGYIMTGSTN